MQAPDALNLEITNTREEPVVPDKPMMPDPEPNGFIKTLNNMGYMTSTLDPFSRDFVAYSVEAPGPVLDIGAAYGVATIQALKAGAAVIANDIDIRHLDILRSRVPVALRSRLTLLPGKFPDEISVPSNSIGAILVARVLHFFDGQTLELAARCLADWLAPGGKLFVVAETPYVRNFQTFIPVYESRRQSGHMYPGFVEDVMAIAPERGKSLPKQMHFLDPEVLSRVFAAASLVVERAAMFARTDFPRDIQLDGRESVGLICKKQQN
jgi:SAM-dependent methyltransferase